MTDRAVSAEQVEQLYVCENCGRLGRIMEDFADDCTPGWTHGKLIRVASDSPALQQRDEQLARCRAALEAARGEIGGILTGETSLSVNRRLCAAVDIIDAALAESDIPKETP